MSKFRNDWGVSGRSSATQTAIEFWKTPSRSFQPCEILVGSDKQNLPTAYLPARRARSSLTLSRATTLTRCYLIDPLFPEKEACPALLVYSTQFQLPMSQSRSSQSTSEVGEGKKSTRWRWIALAIVLVSLFGAARLLPVAQWLEAFNKWVGDLGPWGMVIFIGVYVLATILMVPGSILTVGAGLVFGLGWAFVAVSIGSTIGAALAFLISRFLARERVEALAEKNESFHRIDKAIGEQGAKLILLLRLSPLIPFNLSNYFYGITGVKFWPYVLASWIGMLPGTLLYVYLGSAGRAGLQAASGATAGRSPLEWTFLAVGLAATIGVTIWVTKIARKALQRKDVV
jgi:uncharacterized membrane protein YdjX (TVP38/TMEM64 family)